MAKGDSKVDVARLQADGFATASRELMERAYAQMYGFHPDEMLSDEQLRSELLQTAKLQQIQASAPPMDEQVDRLTRIPNLGPNGKWGGRKRRVVVRKRDPSDAAETFGLGWEGHAWTVRFCDQEQPYIDMPWPYWQALNDAVIVDDRSDKARKFVREENGDIPRSIVKPVRTQLYVFEDLGDTPGTEHLPTGYIEFFSKEARKTSVFKDASPAVLLLIYSKLYDGPPLDPRNQWRPVQLTTPQLRMRIAETLGTEFVDIVNSEIYANVAA